MNPRKRALANIDIEFIRPVTISEITITTAACGRSGTLSILLTSSLENNCDIYEYAGMELIPYVQDEPGSGEWAIAVYRDRQV